MQFKSRGWQCLSLALAALVMMPPLAHAAKWQLESQPEISGLIVPIPSGVDLSSETGAAAGKVRVMVELTEPSASVAYAQALRDNSGLDRKRASVIAGMASRAQFVQVETSQAAFARALGSARFASQELFRVQKALNGVVVEIEIRDLKSLAALPGVKRVIPLYLEHLTNSTSVPYIGTPNVWANNGLGLPAGADGTGMRIGIIDTGIDYLHPDFGGPAQVAADYTTEKTDTAIFTTVGTAVGGSFPTAKVVGGTDFAGDNYTGGNVPVPDANPMDCNGHGSHVSGTAGGFGMTTGGATFAGPYDANPGTYSPLLIGPGTAPKALLYGLRVFGCAGSTGLTTLGIDWAMDPNGDTDLSDHLDVINMSLGSNFGSAVNATALSSDNAAAAGVIVVASAGNASDTYFISGAPGSSTRGIATAASVDDGIAAPFVRINSPASLGSGYLGGTAAFGPALTPTGTTGDVVLALDAADGAGPSTTDGCTTPFTNAAAVNGKIALIDRGTCGFAIKTKNAQLNGAIGVIIANNAPGSAPPGMAGVDATIIIPATSITLISGNALKNGLLSNTVNVTLLGPAGGDTLASFSSRGPRRIAGSPLRLKPDIAAPGLLITSVETGIVCTAQALPAGNCTGLADPSGVQTGTRTLTISGTSMAAPHMAGIMALLRQLHPDWSVEELKALAMNYAIHDVTVFAGSTPPRYGPSRIGAGRVDPSKAAVGSVIAMSTDTQGLVSVTFDPEVVGTKTQTRKVRLVNKGATSQTYDLGFDLTNDAPGVAFSLPGGSSVVVPAGETVELDVQMSATASQMDEKRDPALDATQGIQANYGDQPRNFLTEEEGYLTFSQSATLKFRLPVYMAEKPASDMAAADTIVTGGAGTGSTSIALSGTGLCTGTLGAGPTCTGTFPTDIESLVSPFELQVASPIDPSLPDYTDIQYVGAAYFPNANGAGAGINNDLVMFGVSSWGDWSTLDDVAYDICVDNNNDGVYDKIVINTNPAVFVAGASLNDNFVRTIRDTVTNGNTILGLGSPVNLVGPNVVNTSLHLNNVMLLAATPAQLGMATTSTLIKYKVVTCTATNSGCARTTIGDRCTPAAGTFFDVAAGPFTYNPAAQGLNFGGDFLDEDLNGASLAVSWNTANMTTNGSLGALLLHHHNASGKRAEVVVLDTAQRADLAITSTVDNAAPPANTNVTFTLTVTNNGPNNATGVAVVDFLPDGIDYVSDDGAGTYVAGTGTWTVGALANGASAVLHIVGTAVSTDGLANVADIGAGTPLDPNPANNRAITTLQSPRSADLQIVSFTPSAATANPGDSITFTLVIRNVGQDPAYSVDVQTLFPLFPALAAGSFTASVGVFTPGTGHWDLASLPVGNSATLGFTITVPSMAGALTNNASSSSAKRFPTTKAADPNLGDNTASATVMVTSPATIGTHTKTVTGSFLPASNVTYTITISNTGPFDQQDNPGSEFTDVLPSSLHLVSATASSGTAVATIATNTVTWDGIIVNGSSVTITITATIDSAAVGTVSNQGTISSDADGNGTNETATLTDDPGTAGVNDPTSFVVPGVAQIPTLSTLGLAALAGLLAAGALLLLYRRRSA